MMHVRKDTNVVLITMDTVRPDHLGCYGYGQARTPHIDAFAKHAVIFDQAVTNGSYTKSAFPPILSSTYAGMYGGPFAAVSRRRPMLARLLRAHGYRTAGFTANPLLGANVGYDDGFDTFVEPVPPPESRSWLRVKGASRLLGVTAANSMLMRLGFDTSPHPVYVKGDKITDLACHWLAAQNGKFFLWAHYMDAHWPYHTLARLETARDRAQAWKELRLMRRSRKTYPGHVVVERVKQLYDEGIAYLDQQVGHLLDTVEEVGVASNTLVILASDHGEAFYEHGRWQHGAYLDFYEEIVKVPLIIGLPGQRYGAAPQRVADLVSLLDLAPTILDMVGIPVDPRMEGETLLPVLQTRRGRSHNNPKPVITEMVDLAFYAVSIRATDYKYIYDERQPQRRALYNLKEDPAETKNVCGAFPEVEAQFDAILNKHLGRVRGTSQRDDRGRWDQDDEVVRRLQALGYLE